jgi:hypothetical protein
MHLVAASRQAQLSIRPVFLIFANAGEYWLAILLVAQTSYFFQIRLERDRLARFVRFLFPN